MTYKYVWVKDLVILIHNLIEIGKISTECRDTRQNHRIVKLGHSDLGILQGTYGPSMKVLY